VKRIVAIVMIIFVASLWAYPCFAAEPTCFKMTADITNVSPGDTVTYTVSLGAVENLYGMKLKIAVPEGLKYVEGSGQISEGLSETMNAAKAEFIEETLVLIVGSCEYSSEFDTVLMQFQCTVDADTSGLKVVHFEIDPENVFDGEYNNIPYTIADAAISVDEPCNHQWRNADCTAPKICDLCGAADGAVSEHDWKKPESGDSDGHWYDCSACGLSRLEVHADENEDGRCDICGYAPDKEQSPVAWIVITILVIMGGAASVILIRKKKYK